MKKLLLFLFVFFIFNVSTAKEHENTSKNPTMFTCPTGDVSLSTQAQVDALVNCTTITGNLIIFTSDGSSPLDLSPLNSITTITGTLQIGGLSNNQIGIFPALTSVTGLLTITQNTFTQFSGFAVLTSVGGDAVSFTNNTNLTTIGGFNAAVNFTQSRIVLSQNNEITTITAFANLQTIKGLLIRNTKLTTLSFLSALTLNTAQLSIENNSLLANATFPNVVQHTFANAAVAGGNYFRIQNNPLLTQTGNISITTSTCNQFALASNPLLSSVSNLSTSPFKINGPVSISTCQNLPNLLFFQNLTETLDLTINNSGTTSLNGLQNLTTTEWFTITNTAIQNLNGLSNLISVTNLTISNNAQLLNFTGINTGTITFPTTFRLTINNNLILNSIVNANFTQAVPLTSINIQNNPQLAFCEVPWVCHYLNASSGSKTISNNASACNSAAIVQAACIALSTLDINKLDLLALCPNPANNVLNIEMTTELKSIEIYNIQGQKVKVANQKQINVSDLASGMYMIRIQDSENAVSTKKFLKQ
jgi:hypothetical protein